MEELLACSRTLCKAAFGSLHHVECNLRVRSGTQASLGGLLTVTRMLPPILEQLEGRRCSTDHSESRALAAAPKKSVRFSADAKHDKEITAHTTGPAVHATTSDSRGGSGERDTAATTVGRIDHGDAAGGEASETASTADLSKKDSEAAMDAKRHGLLPTWRVKMPVVQW